MPLRKISKEDFEARQRKFGRTGFALGKQLADFRPPQEDFSSQEEILRGFFGHGEKIWGWKNRPVEIYGDLMPSQFREPQVDEDITADLFGFGASRRRRR